MKEDETVRLVIDNIDLPHGITIPEFDAWGENELVFTADKKGTFQFRCALYCGDDHSDMTGTLIVE